MKFRKKPVIIEAKEFTGIKENVAEILIWTNPLPVIFDCQNGNEILLIPTLEGQMTAQIGDWIIKGVNGEFYPCKPGGIPEE